MSLDVFISGQYVFFKTYCFMQISKEKTLHFSISLLAWLIFFPFVKAVILRLTQTFQCLDFAHFSIESLSFSFQLVILLKIVHLLCVYVCVCTHM